MRRVRSSTVVLWTCWPAEPANQHITGDKLAVSPGAFIMQQHAMALSFPG
jgi:hypothetical protein